MGMKKGTGRLNSKIFQLKCIRVSLVNEENTGS